MKRKTKMCSFVPSLFLEESEEDSDMEDLFTVVFRCTKCSLKFITQQHLNKHKRRAHLKKRRKIVPQNRTIGVKYCDNSVEDARSEDEEEVEMSELAKCSITDEGAVKQEMEFKIQPFSIILTRLKFMEIEVTRPCEGFREIRCTVETDPHSYCSKENSELVLSDTSSSSSAKFLDWRTVTIKALPKRILPPPPPSVPNRNPSHNQPTSQSPPIDGQEEDPLSLKVPDHFYQPNTDEDNNGSIHCILDVITGHAMSSVVLDTYIGLLVSSYNNEINAGIRSAYQLRPTSMTKFCHLSIFFLSVHSKTQCPSTISAKAYYLPKVTIDEDTVIIAPLFSCSHFYLGVFNCYTKCVYVYDSYWNYVSNEFHVEQLKRLLVCLFPKSHHRWNIFFDFHCAQQIDKYSCGCYVAYFAENVLKGKSHRNTKSLNTEEVEEIRVNIVTDLLSTTKTGRQLLQAITE